MNRKTLISCTLAALMSGSAMAATVAYQCPNTVQFSGQSGQAFATVPASQYSLYAAYPDGAHSMAGEWVLTSASMTVYPATIPVSSNLTCLYFKPTDPFRSNMLTLLSNSPGNPM